MIDEICLNTLVCNVVAKNRFSHCRLCLCLLQDHYVRFTDKVSLDTEKNIFQPLSEVLMKLLGQNACDEVPGIDALCTSCVDKVLETARLMELYEKSTNFINNVFSNLSNALNMEIDSDKENQDLFIVVEENNSQLLWMKKEEKRKKKKCNENQYFHCDNCIETFSNSSELKAHNLAVHDIFTCDKCYNTFLSDSELILHESTVHRYQCPDCSQWLSSKREYSEHHEKIHGIVICQDCGKICHGTDKLNIHEQKHSQKFSCPKCNKKYTTRDFYTKHVKLCIKGLIDPHPTRNNRKDYTCEKCAKAYGTPGGLRVHNRFVHGNAKPHICNECGKQFTAPSYLKIHMVKHTGEKNFICDLCGGRFVSKEALLYHTRRHTGEKPYSCKICNERFVNASARAEHIKFKHIGPTLMCDICPRKFVTPHFLKQHISRHHDPSSKLYYGRNTIPPDMPGELNMRTFKINSRK
ncbi:PREDICTED: myoneurin-like [Papilio polytes]|uniref:myoneurin-like n=1 Tax=Papilio polytes TaxID=76194 RepID=UPI0006766B13|nr:PREDICTED: myoneurin-like [Papilio polytes]